MISHLMHAWSHKLGFLFILPMFQIINVDKKIIKKTKNEKVAFKMDEIKTYS